MKLIRYASRRTRLSARGTVVSRPAPEPPLVRDFAWLRLLHYTAVKPLGAREILRRLQARGCRLTAGELNRVLGRLERGGLLERMQAARESEGPGEICFTVTLEGRRELDLARRHLAQLVQKWSRP